MIRLNDVTLVIPSHARAARQTTLAQLGPSLRSVVRLAVYNREVGEYRAHHPGVNVWPIPDHVKGISEKRAWLFTHCPTTYLFMLDDDLTFAYRPVMSEPALRPAGPSAVWMMVGYLLSLAKQYIHVGLSARQGNNRVAEPYRTCGRMTNAYVYNVPAVLGAGVVLGRMRVMEDFDLTLQLLRAGHTNAIVYRWCWNQGGSNQSGGVSGYRTGDVQREAAEQLAAHHPGLVRVVRKQSESWKGMEDRADVVVYWRKAFNHEV